MEVNEALQVVNQVMSSKLGRQLSDAETVLFTGSWQRLTYDEMIKDTPYKASYFKGDVGHNFWKDLSKALGEDVNKRNFKAAIARNKEQLDRFPILVTETPQINYYVEHPKIEDLAKKELIKPGCLLRIKAPPKMGKTTFLSRLINYGYTQGFRGINLSMSLAEKDDFSSLDNFLQFFCISIAQMLGLEESFRNYNWDKQLGNSKLKAMGFFENHLLTNAQPPLVLGLDELDKLFQYTEVTEGFLVMLRSWNETAKINPTWGNLRLILCHVGDYTQLDINQSPFNAGIHIDLEDLDDKQISTLLNQYDLQLETKQIETIKAKIGGHPYLIKLLCQELAQKIENLDEILKKTSTESGIYSEFLRQQIHRLKQESDLDLINIFKSLVTGKKEVKLNNDQRTRLRDLGLIRENNNEVSPRYKLYSLYFKDYIP